MKKSFLDTFFFLYLDLNSDSFSPLTAFRVNLTLLLYFSQTISPLFKLLLPEFVCFSDQVIPYLIFYSNLPNLLTFPKSFNLFFLFYVLAIIIVIYPLFFLLFATILSYYFQIQVAPRAFYWVFCQYILEYFNWVLILPLFEVFINPLDCNWAIYSSECYTDRPVFLIIAVIMILWCFLQGLFLAFSRKNYRFVNNRMECEWGFTRFLVIVLRYLLIVLFSVLKKRIVIYYLLMHFFAVLSFFEYMKGNFTQNREIKGSFFKFLFLFESTLILATLKSYMSLFSQESFTYFFLIFSILSMKLGDKLGYLYQNPYLVFMDEKSIDILGEIKLSVQKTHRKAFYFRALGYFSHHFRKIKGEDDPLHKELKGKFLENPSNFVKYETLVDTFILNKYLQLINSKDFEKSDLKNKLILLYIDYLRLYTLNPRKLMFEFEKLKQKIVKDSFLMDFYLRRLHFSLKEKIAFDELRQKGNEKNKEKIIEINCFLKMTKLKAQLLENILSLLGQKRQFWVDYLSGFKEMNIFIREVQNLVEKIENFKAFLEKKGKEKVYKVVFLKGFSAFHALFRNEISIAMKFEEDYQKLFANELIQKENEKNKLSFIDKNIVTCNASFLTFEGVIKNSSKTTKFGLFFGLSKGEIELIRTIEELMPSYLSSFHSQFIKNYINKQRTVPIKFPVSSYGLHKSGFIFPICMYFSLQSTKEDFLISAAILHDEQNDEQLIVYNLPGEIIGISEKLFKNLKSKVDGFDIKSFNKGSIYDWAPELRDLSENRFSENELFINQHIVIRFPFVKDGVKKEESFKMMTLTTANKQLNFNMDFDLKNSKYCGVSNKIIVIFQLTVKNLSLNENTSKFEDKTLFTTEHEDTEENINESYDIRREDPKSLRITMNLRDETLKEENNWNTKTSGLNQRNKEVKSGFQEEEKKEEKPNIYVHEFSPFQKDKVDDHNFFRRELINDEKKPNSYVSDLTDFPPDPREPNVVSQHSSLLSCRGKNFKVFAGIEKIKRFIPKSFFLLVFGFSFEIILMLCYQILIQTKIENYFQNQFYPSQNGTMRFCEYFSSFAFTTDIATEFEYQYFNLTFSSTEYNYNDIYYQILNRSFLKAQNAVSLERITRQSIYYQILLINTPTNIVDINSMPFKIKSLKFIDFVDEYLVFMKNFLWGGRKKQNYSDMDSALLAYLQANFLYLLPPSITLFTEVRDGFLTFSNVLDHNFTYYIMMFMMLLLAIKTFELIQLFFLYKIVNSLASIFLRCNQVEAQREILFIDNFLEYFRKTEDFFYLNFAERALSNKDQIGSFEEGIKSIHYSNNTKQLNKPNSVEMSNKNKRKSPVKKKYNRHFHFHLNINSIAKTKGFFFILITLLIASSFILLNFYYWTTFNQTIMKIYKLGSSLTCLYTYSISILTCSNLYLRESVLRSPYYEFLNNSYQQPQFRKAFFLETLNEEIKSFIDIFNSDIPRDIIQAKNIVTDPNFGQLIESNICDVLQNLHKVEIDESIICNRLWDGAFNQGILSVTSHYLKEINEISTLRNSSETLQENATQYIADPKHQDLLLGSYFASEAIFLLYSHILAAYQTIIESEKIGLEITLAVSLVGFAFILAFMLILLCRYMKRFYNSLAMSLSILPFEKITEDEITIQIIENFRKNLV